MHKILFLPVVALLISTLFASGNPYLLNAKLDALLGVGSAAPEDSRKGTVTVECSAEEDVLYATFRKSGPKRLYSKMVLKFDNFVSAHMVEYINIPDYRNFLEVESQDVNTISFIAKDAYPNMTKEILNLKPKQIEFHVGFETHIPKNIYYDMNSCQDTNEQIEIRNKEIEEYNSKPVNRLKNYFGF